jgi:hypothetical protein
MGRAAILLVMGLGIAMGYIGKNILNTTEQSLYGNYTYFKYMYARNLARTAIHAALRTYDRNTNPTTDWVAFADGQYRLSSLTTSNYGDTLWMTSEGKFADTSYTIYLTLFRTIKPFPDVNAAIGFNATPATIGFSGNAPITISGFDHGMDGTQLADQSNAKAGITVIQQSDSSVVRTSAGTRAQGIPPVAVEADAVDPNEYIDEYVANADYFYSIPAGEAKLEITGNQTYGTLSNPVIVVAMAANNDTSKKIEFKGGVTGYGILAIRGDVTFKGSITWYGLVLVFGQESKIDFQSDGTPKIIGGLVVANSAAASVTLKGVGNSPKIAYSSEALARASNVGRLRYYTILDWYE